MEEHDRLIHYGVKGQRWGVITKGRAAIGRAISKRKDKSASTESKPKSGNRVTAEVKSVKRQLSWNKKVRDRKKLSDDELKQVLERVKNENNLRRLAKRKEYLKRESLTDTQLKARVDRLQLEDNLKKNVAVTTAYQRDIGKAIVGVSMKVAVSQYNKKKGKTATPAQDIVKNEVMNFINNKHKSAGAMLKIAANARKGSADS